MIFRISIILLVFLFLSCDEQENKIYNFDFEVDPRLEKEEDCYTLTLGQDWQTLHRISGTIYESGIPKENVKFYWESNLYWYLGDTLGYIVRRGLTDDLFYRNIDTFYITGFSGEEVATSNQASYSNSDGEVNNIIAPVRSMRYDTLVLRWYFEYDDYKSDWDSIKICLN